MGEPLYSIAELRELEQAAQSELPPGALMQRAGRAAAAHVQTYLGNHACRAVVICGPGNNGGDGYVCALELAQRGMQVQCVALAPASSADAQAAAARWAAAGGVTLTTIPTGTFDAVVDAMFGIGMARPLGGRYLAAAEWINGQHAPVVALDVPTGLDVDRGTWVGEVAGVRAARTVTFIGAKPGLFTGDGVDAAGHVDVESIGIGPGPSRGTLLGPSDFGALLKPRTRNTHKGSYGSVAVIGGNVGMVGAPLLAARAALRLGAGRVYVDCIGAPELRLDPLQPELMFRPHAELKELSALVIGCGLGEDAQATRVLSSVLARDQPLVIDADALNLIAVAEALADACANRRAPTVLTPHPLEAARLLHRTAAEVQADRVGNAILLAQRFRALVVLKGAGSVIAEPTGRYALNPTGSPALATAGTGDVLAGMIAAFIAQCREPVPAVHAAVWLHGAAADAFGGDVGLVAGDIAPLAARELARLRASN